MNRAVSTIITKMMARDMLTLGSVLDQGMVSTYLSLDVGSWLCDLKWELLKMEAIPFVFLHLDEKLRTLQYVCLPSNRQCNDVPWEQNGT